MNMINTEITIDDYKKSDEDISKPFRRIVSNIFVNLKVRDQTVRLG